MDTAPDADARNDEGGEGTAKRPKLQAVRNDALACPDELSMVTPMSHFRWPLARVLRQSS